MEIEGADASWDFGFGAGFYVNATEPKWAKHFRMYDYVTKELPQLVNANLPVDASRVSVFGHSMGVPRRVTGLRPLAPLTLNLLMPCSLRRRDQGHGALICALKNPGMYKVGPCLAKALPQPFG